MRSMNTRYPADELSTDIDCGVMPENLQELRDAVIGHKIVSAEKKSIPGRWYGTDNAFVLTLDIQKQVVMRNTNDCCAYTDLDNFLLHPELVDHVITGVDTTDGYEKWHIFADMGDVLELSVSWSAGNPFYYGYGFEIAVEPLTIPGELGGGFLEG